MARKHLKVLCLLMAVMVFLLEGCQTQPPATDPQEDVQTPENRVLDASLMEGKLACFFFDGDNDWSAAEEGEHSGDSVLFVLPDGTTIMYDCDTPNNGADIAYALKKLGITKLDYFINSHPHVDHMGGFSIIARHVEIGEVIVSDLPIVEEGMNTPYYRKMMDIIEKKGIKLTKVLEGETLQFGEMTAKVFNPPADFDPNKTNYNESSLVIRFSWKNASFLLGGDAGNNPNLGQKTEGIILEKYGDELKSDIAKLNHHGEPSTQSQSTEWLDRVGAKLYVGCMSAIPNDVEHFRLMKEFGERGATYMHTALEGTVLITTSGDGAYDVYVEQLRPNDYYGSLELTDGSMHIG